MNPELLVTAGLFNSTMTESPEQPIAEQMCLSLLIASEVLLDITDEINNIFLGVLNRFCHVNSCWRKVKAHKPVLERFDKLLSVIDIKV